MKTTRNGFGPASITATALLALSLSLPATAQPASIPSGQTIMTFVNRLLIDPPQVVVFGYFVDIAGLPGPLFLGTPGETTAQFTWSLNAPGALQLQNGDDPKDPGSIDVSVLRSDETFSIYYNANPKQNWSIPASFSAGQLIATFKSEQGTQTGAGPLAFVIQAYSLVGSQDFAFKGQTFNLARLIPHAFTFFGVVSNIPLNGAVVPPLTFAGAGTATASARW